MKQVINLNYRSRRMIKLQRISAGDYVSSDGRVIIRRVVSRQTYRATEVCWSVAIDGRLQAMHHDTKRDAVVEAERLFAKGNLKCP